VVILRESRVPVSLAVEVFEYVPSVHVPDRTPTMHALSPESVRWRWRRVHSAY